MITKVFSFTSSSKASCINFSFSGSIPAVASSRSINGASFKIALAMDILCLFHPFKSIWYTKRKRKGKIMLYIGCHLSTSKGFTAMGKKALELGANTFQYFTRNPRGGKRKPWNQEDVNGLFQIIKDHEFGPLIAHAPYTLNPASNKSYVVEFAQEAIREDLERLEQLPLSYYNFHPGSHVGQGEDQGIA
ncbi:MAG: TIM barrel protein, partial [Tissierellia bacterium]|nr:TIM barrel protein [Tissierellia bacterium]